MTIKQHSILITGGAGFIGSNLCDAFIEKGYKVSCLDNLSTGHKTNITHLLDHPHFKWIEGDIRDLDTCRRAMNDVQYVSHQAALGSVPRSIQDPITSNAVNITGFLNILVAAKELRIQKLVYAASSSTYGDSIKLPKVENEIGKPLSPYAITKYVNELYAEIFFKNYGINSIGLRYFNVFGRRQDPNGAYAAVIPKFVQSFIHHESPTINGDGTHSRDFTYIDNVIQMNLLAIESTNIQASNQVFNVAYGDRIDIKGMAALIKQNLSLFDTAIMKVPVLFGPNRQGDVPHSLASIEKAKQLLNYKPTHDFKTGLRDAIKWYWENLK